MWSTNYYIHCDTHIIWCVCKCKCIYFTLLSMLMIKYVYLFVANTYFSFYRGRTTKTLSLTQ
jgi:hypothetical protein